MKDTRQDLAARYGLAESEHAKHEIVNEARRLLTESVAEELIPPWFGTDWDFYGTSEVPRQGKIACGYFVTTILRDAGFRIRRVRLAQLTSEAMIKNLTTRAHIRRFSNVPIDGFVRTVQEWGPGLYVVGLDNHTGFIVQDEKETWFIHSSYVRPKVVRKEKASRSKILAASRYRVLGKISEDDGLITQWIQGAPISSGGG